VSWCIWACLSVSWSIADIGVPTAIRPSGASASVLVGCNTAAAAVGGIAAALGAPSSWPAGQPRSPGCNSFFAMVCIMKVELVELVHMRMQ